MTGVLQQTMVAERTGDRRLGSEPYRLCAGDADGDQVVGPGVLIGKAAAFLVDHAVDQRRRSAHLVQIDQSGGVDRIVLELAAQRHQKHQAALRGDGVEAGEPVVPDLRGKAIAPQVACAGVIDADPRGSLQSGLLERRLLMVKGLVAFGEQVGNLPRRDQHPEILDLLMEERHRHAALIVLAQQIAYQVRAIMPPDILRQRRHHDLAVGLQIPGAPIANRSDLDDQFLDRVQLVSLEPPPRFRRKRELPLLADNHPGALGRLVPLAPLFLPPRGLAVIALGQSRSRLRALLHAARLQLRPALQVLEARILFCQRHHLGFKLRDLTKQGNDHGP